MAGGVSSQFQGLVREVGDQAGDWGVWETDHSKSCSRRIPNSACEHWGEEGWEEAEVYSVNMGAGAVLHVCVEGHMMVMWDLLMCLCLQGWPWRSGEAGTAL